MLPQRRPLALPAPRAVRWLCSRQLFAPARQRCSALLEHSVAENAIDVGSNLAPVPPVRAHMLLALHRLDSGYAHADPQPGGATMKPLALATLLALGLLSAPLAAEAQPRLQLYGFVQWISGTKLIMMADPGWSVAVDLTAADQRSYGKLRSSDWVTVIGEVARDRSRVIACQVWPDPGPPSPACCRTWDNAESWLGRPRGAEQNFGQPQASRTPLWSLAGAGQGSCAAASGLVARRSPIQGRQSQSQDSSSMGPISATKPRLSPSIYEGKVLNGAKAHDLPSSSPPSSSWSINLETDRTLGFTISPSLPLDGPAARHRMVPALGCGRAVASPRYEGNA
jgi:hypothetical protein